MKHEGIAFLAQIEAEVRAGEFEPTANPFKLLPIRDDHDLAVRVVQEGTPFKTSYSDEGRFMVRAWGYRLGQLFVLESEYGDIWMYAENCQGEPIIDLLIDTDKNIPGCRLIAGPRAEIIRGQLAKLNPLAELAGHVGEPICGDCGAEVEPDELVNSVDGKAKICRPCLKQEEEQELMYDDSLHRAYDRYHECG